MELDIKGYEKKVRELNKKLELEYNSPYAEIDSFSKLKKLIRDGIDINEVDRSGKNLIYWAARNGDTEIVKFLLKKGSYVRGKDYYGNTALHGAQFLGKGEITKALISNGAYVNAKDYDGEIPLHRAARNGFLQSVKILIKNNALINIENREGCTPKDLAGFWDNKEIEDLLERYADKERQGIEESKIDANDIKGIFMSVKEGSGEIVESLISIKADLDLIDDYGQSLLHIAVENGYREIAELLVNYGLDINCRDFAGYTPLHVAVLMEKKEMVKLLISKGAHINAKDARGHTPLHQAGKNYDILKLLIKKGANINSEDIEGKTPLHIAVREASEEIPELLIKSGADVNAKDSAGETPIFGACSEKIAKLLIERGALLDARNRNGKTPLDRHRWAGSGPAKRNNENVCPEKAEESFKDLLKTDRDENKYLTLMGEIGKRVLGVFPFLIGNREESAEKVDYKKEIGLMRPASKNKTSEEENRLKVSSQPIRDITSYGPPMGRRFPPKDKNERDSESERLEETESPLSEKPENRGIPYVKQKFLSGSLRPIGCCLYPPGQTETCTPLHSAVHCSNYEEIEYIINIGTDVNIKNKKGKTPLHIAANEGEIKAAEMLIKNGASVNVKDNSARTPLHWAALNNHTEVIELLIEKGANVNVIDDRGYRPVYLGKPHVSRLLVKKGADLDFNSTLGERILRADAEHLGEIVALLLSRGEDVELDYSYFSIHSAARIGNKELVEYILERAYYSVNEVKEFITPLHLAAKCGHKDMVEYLLEKGAQVNYSDLPVPTPLEFALKEGHQEIADLLIEKGAERIFEEEYKSLEAGKEKKSLEAGKEKKSLKAGKEKKAFFLDKWIGRKNRKQKEKYVRTFLKEIYFKATREAVNNIKKKGAYEFQCDFRYAHPYWKEKKYILENKKGIPFFYGH